MAKELGVSRNTLREAFRILALEGLLRHEANRGVVVTHPSIAALLDIGRIRSLIEVQAVAGCWTGHPAVERMAKAVSAGDEAEAQADWQAVGSANMEFHAAIVALTDSPRLTQFFARILAELRLVFGLIGDPKLLHEPFMSQNRLILDCLQRNAPDEAAALLKDYLARSERWILECATLQQEVKMPSGMSADHGTC